MPSVPEIENPPLPALSPRWQKLLAAHMRKAIKRAAEEPTIRNSSDACFYVLGVVEWLADVNTRELFDATRHNARAHAQLAELADEGLTPDDLQDPRQVELFR